MPTIMGGSITNSTRSPHWVAAKPGPGNLTAVYRELLAGDDVGLLLTCDWLHASLYWSR